MVAAVALAGSPAALAISREDAAAQRRETRSIALINAATRQMRGSDQSCVQHMAGPPASLTHAAPSEALRSAFSLLRRPQIPQDRVDETSIGLRILPAEGIYIDWIRMARAADGHEFYLVLAQSRGLPQPLSRACLRVRHAALVRSLEHASPQLRRLTLGTEARLNREEQPAGGFPRREAIFLFDRDRSRGNTIGGGGGGVDLAFVRRYGLFGSSGSGSDDRSSVSGLLPDGVASIDMTFAQRASRGRHRPAEVYPSAIELTVPVQDNVVSFEVARPAEDASPSRMVWHAADGSVVRVVEPRNR
ncbi:hypothetical protein [Conexibacter sp. CPCC 206217]|uniref:hypothetical protein n=1 Tax=Conexibacter sp. CPCC 206217 TaxID=3064574 RepID=UPI00271E4708|nr:hypothetical protein [Conexibacter sp. CPCC 206217]MDO8213218.1 hypothetical protein [Conexibacter sp. CPCC 206217]